MMQSYTSLCWHCISRQDFTLPTFPVISPITKHSHIYAISIGVEKAFTEEDILKAGSSNKFFATLGARGIKP